MERNKAIELLTDCAFRGIVTFNVDFKEALKAGINALKIIEEYRRATKIGKSVYIVYDKAGDAVSVEPVKRGD